MTSHDKISNEMTTGLLWRWDRTSIDCLFLKIYSTILNSTPLNLLLDHISSCDLWRLWTALPGHFDKWQGEKKNTYWEDKLPVTSGSLRPSEKNIFLKDQFKANASLIKLKKINNIDKGLSYSALSQNMSCNLIHKNMLKYLIQGQTSSPKVHLFI